MLQPRHIAILLFLLATLRVLAQPMTLPGKVDVSPLGAATYTIPIDVVPGTAGVQPTLAVVYNSMSGLGTSGLKWSIQGLHSISRTGQNLRIDGRVAPVTFSNSDRFALDGSRLLLIEGNSYHATNAIYGFEVEDFSRIKRITDGNNFYFLQELANGGTVEYGKDSQHRLADQNGNCIEWMAGKMTDPDGNSMTFTYGMANGEAWIERIDYTYTNVSMQPYASVEFSYAAMGIPVERFVSGMRIGQSRLLKDIVVRYRGEQVRRYTFGYDTDGLYERLITVTLFDADDNELTATDIQWDETQQNASTVRTLQNITDGNYFVCGNFTDDRIYDIAMVSSATGDMSLFRGKADGTNSQAEPLDIHLSTSPVGTVMLESMAACDLDGDGIDEIVMYEPISMKWLRINLRDLSHPSTDILMANTSRNIQFGDFDGDGITEAVALGANGILSAYGLRGFYSSTYSIATAYSNFHTGDFDGDGKAELIFLYGLNSDRLAYNTRTDEWDIEETDGFPNAYQYLVTADFNGDGMTDLLFLPNNETRWKVAVRQGTNRWSTPSVLTGLDGSHLDDGSHLPKRIPVVCDINGDGISDIIQQSGPFLATYLISECYRNDTYATYAWGTFQLPSTQSLNPGHFHLGDFDGNGIVDFFLGHHTQAGLNCSMVYFHEGSHAGRMVDVITDAAGHFTKLYYSTISLMPQRWSGSGMMWMPLPIARDIVVPDGVGGEDTVSYFYGNAMFSETGRQFIGFGRFGVLASERFTETFMSRIPRGGGRLDMLARDSIVQRTAIHPALPQLDRYGFSGLQSVLPAATVVSRNTFLNDSRTRTNPDGSVSFMPYAPRVTEDDLLTNRRTVTRTSLNNYWMPYHRSVSKGYISGSTDIPQYDSTVFSYTNVTLPNGIARMLPSSTKEYNYNSPARDVARVSETTLSYSGGRLASKRIADNGGADITTAYTYSSDGRLIRLTTTPAGTSGRFVSYGYDNTGRFVTSETDHAGRTLTRTFNEATGLVVSETDINGLTTRRSYDSWGRPTLVMHPDSTTERYEYATGSDGYSDVRAYTTYKATGEPSVRTCFDILGREVHSHTDGGGYNDIVYNHRGQVLRKTIVPGTLKYPDATSKLWVVHTYDTYGRPVKDSSANAVNTYSYSVPNGDFRHRVTVTDRRGGFSTRMYDAAGRVVAATDNGASVTYSFDRIDENGVVLDRTVVTSEGNTTTVLSDSRGNRVRLTDPDAGTVTSTYNAWGELLTHTDGKGDATTTAYDNLGRIVAREYSGGDDSETYSYTYGTTAPELDKVTSVHKGGSVCRQIAYDRHGRIASDTRIIDGNAFTHAFSYDTAGRLRVLRYPDGYRVRHVYDNLGRLAFLANDSTGLPFYNVMQRNQAGQTEMALFSNGTGMVNTYDNLLRPAEIRYGHTVITWPSGFRGDGLRSDPFEPPVDTVSHEILEPENPVYTVGNQYSAMQYTYDNDGYIVRRLDSRSGQCENYTYDALGRLTEYTAGDDIYTFSYSSNGNMTANSRVSTGDYSYDATQPHAVSSVMAHDGLINASRCDVIYGIRNRATSIAQDGWQLDIAYGDGLQREMSMLSHNGVTKRTSYHVGRDCEVEVTAAGTRHIDAIRADGRVVALHVRNTAANTDSLYFVHTDILGSWERIVDGNKNIVQSSHFDPWGNRMSSSDWTVPQDGSTFAFRRGFTGHEHYDLFGIINMNARLYDPVLGRFFSPDPQVQSPYSSQGLNRYSYCSNNPVMFTDPDGEFLVVDSWILGFIHGFTSTGSNRWRTAWNTANRIASNDIKLWGGMIVTDPNKSSVGQIWEVISRFTWQLPQTVAGFTMAQACNTAEGLGLYAGIESVNYLYGATIVTHKSEGWGAVTLGSYINGSCSLKPDPENSLFQHEYGHYIQSQAFGIFYLSRYGIPSGLNSIKWLRNLFGEGRKHNHHPVEQDANIRAFKYFNKYIDGYNEWNFISNPIIGYDQYLPYDNPQNQAALHNGLLRPAWYNYLFPGDILFTGLINWLSLENY